MSEISNNMTRLMAVETSLKENPHDAELLGLKGNFKEALGKYDEALAAYEEALKHHPKDLPNLHNKAYCLARLKRYKEAIVCCNVIVSISEEDSKALALMGALLQRMDLPGPAIAVSFMALYEDPASPLAHDTIKDIRTNRLTRNIREFFLRIHRHFFPVKLPSLNTPKPRTYFSGAPPPSDWKP